MPNFKVIVVREAGPSPVNDEFLDYAEEEMQVEALDKQEAYKKSQRMCSLKFFGQTRRTYIDGMEYFNSDF